ncbi:MAG: hypothetical protein IJC74_00825 [Clostridia bacterium]|nr:hypothetical protein [Clostridia bacterium]
MFGYVNVYKDELKIKDYNTFRGFYCGLCKILGNEFSQSVRMGLNYDFAFLALVLSSLSKTQEIKQEKCIIHPINKRPVVKNDEILVYSAYMSVITTYFKLADDCSDKKNLKSLIALLFYKRHLKKAKKRYPEEYKCINEQLKRLKNLEKANSCDTDETADCFAKILEKLFSPQNLETDDISKKALANFGYNLGRFIYLIDAYDDIGEDIKNKNYNPVVNYYRYNGEDINNFTEKIKDKVDFGLMLTLDSVAKAFELIEFKKNRELISNIVYLGLRNKKDSVLTADKDKETK